MSHHQLEKIPLFDGIPVEAQEALLSHSEERELPRGKAAFVTGDSADELFTVMSGKMKITLPSRQDQSIPTPRRGNRPSFRPSKESILTVVGPGGIFGESGFYDEAYRYTTARAITPAVVLAMPMEDLRTIMAKYPQISHEVLSLVAERLINTQQAMAGLILSDVPGRLAQVLLTLANQFGTRTSRGIEVTHDLTQTELAQMVGASRETVNKVLTDFTHRRWIAVKPRSILIREPGRLRGRTD